MPVTSGFRSWHAAMYVEDANEELMRLVGAPLIDNRAWGCSEATCVEVELSLG